MKTSSAKAKGRKLQDWVKNKLIEYLDEDHTHELDKEITTAIMGENGADVKLSSMCEHLFPFSIECKNQEKINIWESYKQADENSKDYEPVVVLKRNNHKPLVLVDATYFVELHNRVAKELTIDELLTEDKSN